MKTHAGTPSFMAPEIIKSQAYSRKCDIWSLGCILYILVTGHLPFMGTSIVQIYPKILNCDYEVPESCSDEIIDLLKHMLMIDVTQRYTAQQCLHHPWFDTAEYLQETKKVKMSPEILKSLKSFKSSSRLHKTVLQMLVRLISRNELGELSRAFEAIDLDNSGVISREELTTALKKYSFKISEEELNDIFAMVETDANGQIEYTEFLAATINVNDYLTREKTLALFR
jgi:calcium-dependent protein kinase